MQVHIKRIALLMVALCVVVVAFAACQAPASTGTGQTQGQSGINVFHTPTPPAPTPTFPPFTIGAWPSNFSPNNGDTITIYALCRVQNQSMTGPAQAATVSVNFFAEGIGLSKNVATGSDGLAAWTLQVNGAGIGQTIIVDVSATYNGQIYKNSTFFTVSPAAAPKASPTPTGGGNGNGGGGNGNGGTPPASTPPGQGG